MPASLHHCLSVAALITVAAASVATATPIAPAAQLYAQPAAPEERAPPPRNGGSVTWLPGQWRSTGVAGAEWQWEPGRYVAWPADRNAAVIDPSQSTPNVSGWLEDDGQ